MSRKTTIVKSARNGTLPQPMDVLPAVNVSICEDMVASSEKLCFVERRKSQDYSRQSRLKTKAVKDTPLINKKILIQIGEQPSRFGSRRTSAPLRNGKTVLEDQLNQVYGTNEGIQLYMAGLMVNNSSVQQLHEASSLSHENVLKKRQTAISALISKQMSPMNSQNIAANSKPTTVFSGKSETSKPLNVLSSNKLGRPTPTNAAKQSGVPDSQVLMSLEPYINQSQKKRPSTKMELLQTDVHQMMQMAPYDDQPVTQFADQCSYVNQNENVLHADQEEDQRLTTAQQNVKHNIKKKEFKEHLREIVQSQLKASRGSAQQLTRSPRAHQKSERVLETQRSIAMTKRDSSRQRGTAENREVQVKGKSVQKPRNESVKSRIQPLKHATVATDEDQKYKDLNKLLQNLVNGQKVISKEPRANSQETAMIKEINSVQASLKDLNTKINQIKINPQGNSREYSQISTQKRSKAQVIKQERQRRQQSHHSIQCLQNAPQCSINSIRMDTTSQQVKVKKGLAFRVDRQSLELAARNQVQLIQQQSEPQYTFKQKGTFQIRSKSRSNAITNVNLRFDNPPVVNDMTPMTIQQLHQNPPVNGHEQHERVNEAGEKLQLNDLQHYCSTFKHKRNTSININSQLPKIHNNKADQRNNQGSRAQQAMPVGHSYDQMTASLQISKPNKFKSDYEQRQLMHLHSQRSVQMQSSVEQRSESQLRGLRHSPLRSQFAHQTGTSPLYCDSKALFPTAREPACGNKIASFSKRQSVNSMNSSQKSELERRHGFGLNRNSYEDLRFYQQPELQRSDEKNTRISQDSEKRSENGIYLIKGSSKLWAQDRFVNNDVSKFNALNKVKESYASFNTNRSQVNQKSRAHRKRLDFYMSNREVGFTQLTPLKNSNHSLFASNNHKITAVQTSDQSVNAKRFYTTVNGDQSSTPVTQYKQVSPRQSAKGAPVVLASKLTQQQSVPNLDANLVKDYTHDQAVGIYGGVMHKRTRSRVSSRNSPQKLQLSNVYEEDENPLPPQANLDLEWSPLKMNESNSTKQKVQQRSQKNNASLISQKSQKSIKSQKSYGLQQEDHMTFSLAPEAKGSINRISSKATMQELAQIERLLAQKRTLKEVSAYRKLGKGKATDAQTRQAQEQESLLQVSGEHVSLKNKPGSRSGSKPVPDAGIVNKSKAIAHLRKHLNGAQDRFAFDSRQSKESKQEMTNEQEVTIKQSLTPHLMELQPSRRIETERTQSIQNDQITIAMPPTLSPARETVEDEQRLLIQINHAASSIECSEFAIVQEADPSLTNLGRSPQPIIHQRSDTLAQIITQPQAKKQLTINRLRMLTNPYNDSSTNQPTATLEQQIGKAIQQDSQDDAMPSYAKSSCHSAERISKKQDASLQHSPGIEQDQLSFGKAAGSKKAKDIGGEQTNGQLSVMPFRGTEQPCAELGSRQVRQTDGQGELLMFDGNEMSAAVRFVENTKQVNESKEDQDTIPSNYNSFSQSFYTVGAEVQSPKILSTHRGFGEPPLSFGLASLHLKQDLKRMDSPTILAAAQQKKLTCLQQKTTLHQRRHSKAKAQDLLETRDLYNQLNVPFPSNGNTYESLALLPDFKTRHQEWQTSANVKRPDANHRIEKVWLSLAKYNGCFAPATVIQRKACFQPQLEIFDFF